MVVGSTCKRKCPMSPFTPPPSVQRLIDAIAVAVPVALGLFMAAALTVG
jgi:hypothetical protein